MKVRKEGLLAIEADLEKPEESKLFQQYPVVLDDHHMVVFITDCLRLMVGGNLDPHELESLLEYELETHHKEAHEPAHAVQKVADALPGFGIVAAVLGIVNTMSALEGADTATIGHKVGAALVGTFLGILVSYGFVGPIAEAMEPRPTTRARPSKSSRWRWWRACAATRRRWRWNSRASCCSATSARRSPTSRTSSRAGRRRRLIAAR